MPDPASFDVPLEDVTLAGYLWEPSGPPRAVVQLAHGVGEHATRYRHVADALVDAGFVVYAHDHRGHGESVTSAEEYGRIGASGWHALVADLGRVGALAREAHPGLPLALVAHSLGSFATQQWLPEHSHEVDAVVLSGTASVDPLAAAIDLDAPMDLSMFNAPFQPQRTDSDWLSRDEAEVDKYVADPQCGFGLDAEAMRELFDGAARLADPAQFARVRDDLPVLMVVGEHDPVNGQLALVHLLRDRLTGAGLTDVTLTVYPEARHEVFNETNRDEVVADVVTWLTERL